MNNSKSNLPETHLQKVPQRTNHNGFWLTVAGAVVGTAGYLYLTQTKSGRQTVKRTKSKLDDYLAGVENRLAEAQYRAEYEGSL